jgi:large subunit ribosomal protein L30
MAKKKAKTNMLRVKLVRSLIGNTKSQRATVWSLGLNRINSEVEQPDTPVVRGMLARVAHLVEVTEAE